MSEIRVVKPHRLGTDAARARLSQFEDQIKKFGVSANWSGNQAVLKGTGVSGSISVSDADVTVLVKLGMLARAAGVDPKRLEGSISRRLEEAFGASP